jgi:hypothetical protein
MTTIPLPPTSLALALFTHDNSLASPRPADGIPGIRCTRVPLAQDAVLVEAVGFPTPEESEEILFRVQVAAVTLHLQVRPAIGLYPALVVCR